MTTRIKPLPIGILFDVCGTLMNLRAVAKDDEVRSYVEQFERKPYQPMRLPESWEKAPPFEDTVQGITRLAAKYKGRLWTLSNVPADIVWQMLAHAGLTSFVGVVTLEDARVYKPDPRAYEVAAKWLGLEPSECLMVSANARIGNSGESDVSAAAKVGMPGVLIRQKAKDQTPLPDSPQTLIELAEWLGC